MGGYLIPLLIATLTAVSLRTAALFTDLNFGNAHFNTGALIFSADVIIAIFSIFAFTYLIFGAKQNLKATFAAPSTYVPSGLVGICLLFISVTLLGYGLDAPEGVSLYENLEYPLALICSALALPSALHFFLNAYVTDVKNETRAFFSMFTVLFLAFYTAFLYFSKDLPLNAPNKIVDQMAFLFTALFFLYEARISLGTEVWRGYISFGMIGAVLSAYSAIPSLIFYLFKSKTVSNSVEENLLLLSVFIFISLRLCLTATLRDRDDDGGISTLRKYADERQMHVSEEEAVYKDAFAIQMTIDDLGAYDTPDNAERTDNEAPEIEGETEEVPEDAENITFDFDTSADIESSSSDTDSTEITNL